MPGLSSTARAGMLAQQIYFTYANRRGFHPMMGGIWRRRTPAARRVAVTDAEAARAYLADACSPQSEKTRNPQMNTDERRWGRA